MRRLMFLFAIFVLFSTAVAVCDYDDALLDWTGKPGVNFDQRDLPDDGEGNLIYVGANITEVNVALGNDYLYFNFEISEREKINDSFMYALRLYPHMSYIDYFEVYMDCGDIIGLFEKPYTGARINWTANANWPTIKEKFEAAAHQNSLELKFPLELFDEDLGSDIDFGLRISYDSFQINDIWTSGSVDLCHSTGLVCGDGICEGEENSTLHPCVCPSDCPDIELICIDAFCGNGECEKGEATTGSQCECPEDCPIGIPCELGEPLIDWSGATTLTTSTHEPWQNINGSDLAALKAKVDSENLYLKIDLDSDETPHENVTYTIRLNPWMGGIEYITLGLRCEDLYGLMEKMQEYQSPTNHTSNPAWNTIKSHFEVSTTEHAVEIAIPWFLLYYSDGTGIEVRSYYGSDEVDNIFANVENIVSLFVSNCGDDTCSADESDPNNRYQYCEQDCSDAPEPLCGNGVCDLGENDRWSTSQCIWDCPEAFTWMNDGGYFEPPTQVDDFMKRFGPFFILVPIIMVGAVGAWFGGKRIYKKATAGKRKIQDLQKRMTGIEHEMKDLQKKYLKTAISEAEFKEKMASLEREQQNLDLQIKKMKKKKNK